MWQEHKEEIDKLENKVKNTVEKLEYSQSCMAGWTKQHYELKQVGNI